MQSSWILPLSLEGSQTAGDLIDHSIWPRDAQDCQRTRGNLCPSCVHMLANLMYDWHNLSDRLHPSPIGHIAEEMEGRSR